MSTHDALTVIAICLIVVAVCDLVALIRSL